MRYTIEERTRFFLWSLDRSFYDHEARTLAIWRHKQFMFVAIAFVGLLGQVPWLVLGPHRAAVMCTPVCLASLAYTVYLWRRVPRATGCPPPFVIDRRTWR